MAHELTISKLGRAEMAYFGAPPWHAAQTKPVSLSRHATAVEMMEAASLNWLVESQPLYIKEPDGTFTMIDEVVANVRSDTRERLGIVTPDYSIIQNLKSFQIMDAIVGEAAAMYETAGSLNGGRRIW